MEGIGLDNILGEQEIETLFTDPNDDVKEESHDEDSEEKENDNEQNETTEVVDPEELFDGEEPESVGSDEDTKGEEDTAAVDEDGTSPKHFYSSIANALAVDGIFPNLDDDAVKKVDSAEAFSDLIEAEINARLDERQQRVAKALDNGVEASDIKKYEGTLSYISSITDAAIAEDSEQGETLRKNLIYQDFLNKGYSAAKAQKLTQRTIDAGTDIEDAKEALQSNKEYFQDAYNELLKEAQEKADEEKANRQAEAEKLKESIMKDKQLFGDIELSNDIRKKAFDTISRPVYKDTETGRYLTALQKYEMENRADFLKYTGLIYTLTNGFKDFDSFTKGKVKKEVNKGLRELEQTLNSTRRNSNGSLKMVTSAKEDPESCIGRGLSLDI